MTAVPEQSGSFEVVRRGYAREQVDASVRDLEQRAVSAENALRLAEQHAASATEELRQVRAATPVDGMPAVPESFGLRAERVLRLAEHEGAEMRAAAAREGEALREAARREAGEIRAAATREAAELMGRAHADAAAARSEASSGRGALAAEREALNIATEAARQRAEDLEALRLSIRGELSRLHAALGAELRGLDQPIPTPPAGQPVVAAQPIARPAGEPWTRPAPWSGADAGTPPISRPTYPSTSSDDSAGRTQLLRIAPGSGRPAGGSRETSQSAGSGTAERASGAAGEGERPGPDRPAAGPGLFEKAPDVRIPAQRADDDTDDRDEGADDPDGNRHALRTP